MRQRRWEMVLVGIALFLSACGRPGTARPAEPPLRAQYALGAQRVLVLAVSFPNVQTTVSTSQIKERVLEKAAQYYAEASYGKTALAGDVKGWYPLPRPLEDYQVSPYNIDVDRSRVRGLVEDSFNAAEKDVVFSQYDHVIIVVGAETEPGVGYGMIAYSANPGMLAGMMRHGTAHMEEIKTAGGQSFNKGIIVVAQNAHTGHIVHDLAHALGGAVSGKRPIPDLYDTVLQGKVGKLTLDTYPKFTQFMGPWDVMSRHFVRRDLPPPGMSSFTRLRMGWIGDDQIVQVAPGESQTAKLSPLGGGKGTLVVRVPGRGSVYYLLENRQETASDPVLPSHGLLVLQVDESREDGDGIVQVVDANPQAPYFSEATFGLEPGQTPSVTLPDGATIQVMSQSDGDLTIRVSP